jgi:hypothetical protein
MIPKAIIRKVKAVLNKFDLIELKAKPILSDIFILKWLEKIIL